PGRRRVDPRGAAARPRLRGRVVRAGGGEERRPEVRRRGALPRVRERRRAGVGFSGPGRSAAAAEPVGRGSAARGRAEPRRRGGPGGPAGRGGGGRPGPGPARDFGVGQPGPALGRPGRDAGRDGAAPRACERGVGPGLARALGRGGRPSGRQRALAGPAVRARPVGRLGRSDERHQPAGRQGAEAEGEAPAVPGAVARRGGAPHGAGHLLPPLPQGKCGPAGRGALLRELPAPPRRLAQGNDPGEPRRRGRVPVSVEKGGPVRRLEAASSAAPLRSSKARLAALAAAAVLLAAVAAAGLRFGSVPVTAADAFDALFRYSPESYEQTVVRFLRLPRTVIGLGAGAALAVAGAALQATTRNPLADPSILGVNAGAAFGV